MKSSLVSVIIPTYNRAGYLGSSIDSVLGQDFDKSLLEVIVVDDGSTDNTRNVVKKYGKRLRYYEIPHSGNPAVARNFGIEKAGGEIIAFLDSDDIWAKDKLKNQYKVFESDTVVLSYGQASIIDEKGKKTNDLLVDKNSLSNGENFANLLKSNVVSTLTVMARKSVVKQVGCFNEEDICKGVEDYELWLKILSKYPEGVKCVDKNLAFYRRHSQNISSVNSSVLALKRITNAYRSLWKHSLSESQRKTLESQIFETNKQIKDSSSKETLISVVMSVFNGEHYLRQSIESVLNQTYRNFEFIIIDDGSTDKSPEIIQSYNDKRIRLIQQGNHGLAYSLDKAIGVAVGQFIARQDQDDVSLPTRLEKELQLLISRPSIGVVGTFFTYFDEDTLEPKETISQPFKDVDIRRSLLIHNPIGHGTAMFKKSIYEKVGPYTDELGPIEDFQLWLKASDVCDFAIVPENLYLYRLNSTGMSNTGKDEQKIQTAKLIKQQWNKKFPHKSTKVIVADGNLYKNCSSPFSDQLYNQYLSQNYHLAISCINRGWTRWGLQIILALRILDKTYFGEVKWSLFVVICKKLSPGNGS